MQSVHAAVRSVGLPLVIALAAGSAGCALQPSRVAAAPAILDAATSVGTVSDRLFFGRAIPSGGEVSDDQWSTFVADTITPRFPDGFTIWRATGHWGGDDGKFVQEATMVLEVFHTGDAAAERAIDEIADAYRRRFGQDAVLRVRMPAGTRLYRR